MDDRRQGMPDAVAAGILELARKLALRRFQVDPNAAEEIAQMAAVRAFREYHKRDTSYPVPVWVTVLVGNSAAEHFKANRRRLPAGPQQPPPRRVADDAGQGVRPEDDRVDPRDEFEDLVAAERRAAVALALSACDPADVELVTLRFVYDLSVREIAGRLGRPEPETYRRLLEAVGRVRAAFEAGGLESLSAEATVPADFAGEEVMTKAEAAVYKGVSAFTLSKWVQLGRLRVFRRDHRTYFSRRQLDRIFVDPVRQRIGRQSRKGARPRPSAGPSHLSA